MADFEVADVVEAAEMFLTVANVLSPDVQILKIVPLALGEHPNFVYFAGIAARRFLLQVPNVALAPRIPIILVQLRRRLNIKIWTLRALWTDSQLSPRQIISVQLHLCR